MFALIVVLGIAAVFRLTQLNTIPPALNFDEAGNGIAALDVAQGNLKIWWDIGGGKEPLMAYLTQPLIWIFGQTSLALRLYGVLMGIATVATTYFLAYQLLFHFNEDKIYLRWLPFLSALGVATAFWHVAYSRIAFRALAVPVFEALTMAYLWRMFRTNRQRDAVLAGIFMGVSFYTYPVARFIPVVIGVFLALESILSWFHHREPLLLKFWHRILETVIAATIIALPLIVFFVSTPQAFFDRASAVSLWSYADIWGTFWQTFNLTMGTFLAYTGDPNALANIPTKPQLSILFAFFFVSGMTYALSLSFSKQKYHPIALMLLTAWGIMLLPALLAPEGAPHHLRLIGTTPFTYILIGLGLLKIMGMLSAGLSIKKQWLGIGLASLVILDLQAGKLIKIISCFGERILIIIWHLMFTPRN